MNRISGQSESDQQERRRDDVPEQVQVDDVFGNDPGVEKRVAHEGKDLQEARRDQQPPERPSCLLDQTGPDYEKHQEEEGGVESVAERRQPVDARKPSRVDLA